MPSVFNSRRSEWFSPVTCEICYKALGNAQALACHLRTHMIDMTNNPKPATFAKSMDMFNFSSAPALSGPSPSYLNTNIHQSLLSPSSFSIFDNRSGLVTNPSSRYNQHHGALSPTMDIHKPSIGFNGPMKYFNKRFAIMETPSTLYNVDIPDDGITRLLICQLDRPLPEVIELDSDGEENEVRNEEILDLSLRL